MPVYGSIETLVAKSQHNEQGTLAIAALIGGGWVVLWGSNEAHSQFTDYDVYGQVFNEDGSRRGTQFRTTTSEVGGTPTVTATGDGGFVVSWTGSGSDPSDEKAFVRKYDASGVAVGSKVVVDSGPFDLVETPDVVSLSQNRWLVTYSGNGGGSQRDILQRVFSPNSSNEVTVNTYTTSAQSKPSTIVLDDGGWVTVWQSVGQEAPTQSDSDIATYGSGIYAQRFDATGAKVGAETHVNTTVPGDQTDASITHLENGGWVIAWTSTGQGVCFQVFGTSGSPIGAEQIVGASNWGEPTVTALGGGRFVVTWTRFDTGVAFDVYQRLYEADGTPVGAETRVNTFTDYFQYAPRVLALDGGGWVTIWTSGHEVDDEVGHPSQDGSGNGVYQQVFDAEGNRDGPETQVAIFPDGSQDDFQADVHSGGRAWTITWATREFDSLEGESHFKSEQVKQRTFQFGTNAAPSDIVLNKDSVAEAAAAGTRIGKFTVTDPDSSRFNWWLADDAGGRFAIDAETGKFTVRLGYLLDYEQATSHQVTVAVSDGTMVYQETLTLNITDVAKENVVAGKASETLVGGDGNDTLDGGSKGYHDTLIGRGGRDHLIAPDKGAAFMRGGSGRDTLDGGIDKYYRDTADYSDKSKAIEVDLNGSTYSDVKVGSKHEDTIRNIEDVIGGEGDDWIGGSDRTNSLVGGEGRDTLLGAGGADYMEGGNGKDSLSGGGEHDYLVGGQGRDILRGGEGRDWFSYRYIETAAPDTIKDFVHGTDKIEFLFEFAEAVGGDVSPSELQLGTAANDPNDFVIYDRETGRLYIDVDGDGAGAQIHFATLSTKPKLDSDDFL